MTKKSFFFLPLIALLFTSCHNEQAANMFGKIPSNYENEMLKMTQEVKKTAKGPNAVINGMFAKTDSVFKLANLASLSEVRELVGKTVAYTIDDDVDLSLKSDIFITDVYLPNLYADDGNGALTDLICFDAETNESMLYYTLEGDNGPIAYGEIGTALKGDDGLNHFQLKFAAPNVPAKYQEACKTIHFISYQTLQKLETQIKDNQDKWRDAYSKKLGI